jgi:hypothetical protein
MPYTEKTLNKLDFGTHPWFFTNDLRYTFTDFERNVDIEKLLEKVGVLVEPDQADSETSAFVCNFKTKARAVAFLSRLNKFIATGGVNAVSKGG